MNKDELLAGLRKFDSEFSIEKREPDDYHELMVVLFEGFKTKWDIPEEALEEIMYSLHKVFPMCPIYSAPDDAEAVHEEFCSEEVEETELATELAGRLVMRFLSSSLCEKHKELALKQSAAEFVADHEGKCLLCIENECAELKS